MYPPPHIRHESFAPFLALAKDVKSREKKRDKDKRKPRAALVPAVGGVRESYGADGELGVGVVAGVGVVTVAADSHSLASSEGMGGGLGGA
jgi:hypothetical protein